MAQPEFSIQDMIDNAIGEKPATVQKAFDSVITQKVADIIGGKKQSFNKGLFDPVLGSEEELEDQPEEEVVDDEALEAEPSEEEADEVIDELEADGPEEEEEPEVEEIEDEQPEEQPEQEDTADADVEEEDGEIT